MLFFFRLKLGGISKAEIIHKKEEFVLWTSFPEGGEKRRLIKEFN